ncbi:MAG: sodium/proline symporter PutP [Bacillota bacterium]
MTTEQILILISIFVYLGGMVFIGIRSARKTQDVKDFYLGGRKLGPVVTAMSAEASDMSSWLLMGLPGVAYLTGIADAGWTAIGLGIGTYLNWLIVAKRIRLYTLATENAITIPDFFSRRFRDDKNYLMAISAIMIIIFFIPYTASGFAACGKLFNSLFGVDYMLAMLISAAVIISYTALGGFLAASTTDLLQSIVMSIALLIVVFFALGRAGGVDSVLALGSSMEGYFSMTSMHDMETGGSTPYGIVTILSGLAWGLGYVGMPHILLRFMAIEDENKLYISRRIATIWVVISMIVAICIGLVGYGMTAMGNLEFLEGSAAETIIIEIAKLLSLENAALAIVAGLILAGILAATMSTADSQLLTAASAVSHNFLNGYMKKNLDEKQSMKVARVSVIVIALVAVFIARDQNSSVFGIVSFAWAGFGGTFGPVMMAALFWKRANKEGALAGMLVGGVTVFVWKYMMKPMGGFFGVYELLPAFILGGLAIIIVSLNTAPPSQEIEQEFDRVADQCR